MGCGCTGGATRQPEVAMANNYVGKTVRATVDLPGLECPERPDWPHAGDEFVWTECVDVRADVVSLLATGAVVIVEPARTVKAPEGKAAQVVDPKAPGGGDER